MAAVVTAAVNAAGPGTASLVVRMTADPAPPGVVWSYAVGAQRFELGASGSEKVLSDLGDGTYRLAESGPAGSPMTLTALTCSDPSRDSTVVRASAVANVALSAGETVTCTFVHRALGPRPAAAAAKLADQYAPELRLSAGERYRPLRLEDFLSRTTLRSGSPPNGGALDPAPTLFTLPSAAAPTYLDIRGAQPSFQAGRYPGIERELELARPKPTVYYHLAYQPAAQRVAIEYWFLYLYNDFYDKHEADWEGLTVFLDHGVPLGATYSQHQATEVGRLERAPEVERPPDPLGGTRLPRRVPEARTLLRPCLLEPVRAALHAVAAGRRCTRRRDAGRGRKRRAPGVRRDRLHGQLGLRELRARGRPDRRSDQRPPPPRRVHEPVHRGPELGLSLAATESPRRRRFVAAHAVALAVAFVALGGVAASAVIYSNGYASGKPIRADGVGYYIYLPAVFLDHDLSLRRTVDRSFGGNLRRAGELRRARHGYLGPHQIGEAIMLLPFFGVGHVLAVVSGSRRDGFSPPYQGSAVAGGLLYGLAGLALLGAFLRRWFDRWIVCATLLALTFGTNLFHYLTYDAVYSHAFSFAAIAFVLWSTVRLAERQTPARALTLGVGIGLVAAIRPTNLVVVLFPLLMGVRTWAAAGTRARALLTHPQLLAAAAGGFLVPVMLQLLYWHHVSGRFIVNAYGASPRLELTHPHLLAVAFSVRKGLFFWTPLVALAVAGLALLRSRAPGLLLAVPFVLALDFWVVASWSQWWYGGSFGQRAFVDSLPLFAIGLAALFDWARASRARLPVALAAILTGGLALHAMIEYWLGHIPYDGTTWPIYLHSLTRL